MLAIVIETVLKASWEKSYLVQSKIKCLEVELDFFAGPVLETCSQLHSSNDGLQKKTQTTKQPPNPNKPIVPCRQIVKSYLSPGTVQAIAILSCLGRAP